MHLHTALQELHSNFKKHANSQRSVAMAAYMRNRFEFLGLPKPQRSYLESNFLKGLKNESIDDIHQLVDGLWNLKEREFQYTGLQVLWQGKQQWNHETLNWLEYLITQKSWWDTVDVLAGKLMGHFLLHQSYSECHKHHKRWIKSDNLWILRCSLIFQLSFKNKTHCGLLETSILKLKHHPDFFIQKAIGWSLRQYAKTNPTYVQDLCRNFELKGLAKREALKHLL